MWSSIAQDTRKQFPVFFKIKQDLAGRSMPNELLILVRDAHPSRNPKATKKSRASGDICKIARSKRNILMSFTWGTNEKMKKKLLGVVEHVALGFRDGPIFYVCGGRGDGLGNFQKKKLCTKIFQKKRSASSGKKIEQLLSAIINFDIR